ncbi:unnamed protein product [Schistosoma turkestanicum]|nr:unnamed protein product [Schistosoma turkestanicum]
MNFHHCNNEVLQSTCTTTTNKTTTHNDGIDEMYFDETESLINHARCSPMNVSVDTVTTPSASPTRPFTTTMTTTTTDHNDDDECDRNDNETNSHTTIDEDLMNSSYTASLSTENNDHMIDINTTTTHNNNNSSIKKLPTNSLSPLKKSEKQVTFQDIVEISTIYSIINESQESISHHYEEDNNDDVGINLTINDNIHEKNRFNEVIDNRIGLVVVESKSQQQNKAKTYSYGHNHIVSEKDLLTVSYDRIIK